MRPSTDRVIENLVPMMSVGNINKRNNLFQLHCAFSGGLFYTGGREISAIIVTYDYLC